ncbi:MAG: DNA polymerase III subunit [Pseudomonadota bacterium]|nr:DNA polymerase III subunit [Pseudomonadota bacterium]
MLKSPKNTYKFNGNKNIEDYMLNSLTKNHLHHAYLLSGIQGIGKATFAYRVSRYLLSGSKDQSLYVSKSDKTSNLIEKKSHPDFMVLEVNDEEKKTVIDIEQVRDCINFFNHTPAISGYKVCIIDSIEDMNNNSSNAILKILEEPPINSVFFIISHNPESLMPTIKSRCIDLQFKRFNSEELENYLFEEGFEDTSINLKRVMRFSNGSLGKCMQLLSDEAIDLNLKVQNLFLNYSDLDIYELISSLNNNKNLSLFYDLVISYIEERIKNLSNKGNYKNKKDIISLFEIRDDIHKIIYDGQYYNNLKNHIIIDLLFLIRDSNKIYENIK